MERNELLMENINLVYSVIHRKFPSLIGDEDFVATAMLAAVEATNSWDEEKGRFAPHLYKQVEYALYKELARRREDSCLCSIEDKSSNKEGALSWREIIPTI